MIGGQDHVDLGLAAVQLLRHSYDAGGVVLGQTDAGRCAVGLPRREAGPQIALDGERGLIAVIR